MAKAKRLEAIKKARQRIYGDPRENHRGIAQAWAGLLQPHARAIGRGEPLPEHVVALLMAAMKLNRMRRVFHQDNYDDLANYLAFARAWQCEAAAGSAVASPALSPSRGRRGARQSRG